MNTAATLPVIRIIVPDQNFDDTHLTDLIPEATDPIYQCFQIQVGDQMIEPSRIATEANYLSERVKCLKKEARCEDAVAAFSDSQPYTVCCITNSYGSSTLQPFQECLKAAEKHRMEIESSSTKKKVIGYEDAKSFFDKFKVEYLNHNFSYTTYAVEASSYREKLSILLNSVGKVKKIAKEINAILQGLLSASEKLKFEIEKLKKLRQDLESKLTEIVARIVDITAKMAPSTALDEELDALEVERAELQEQEETFRKQIEAAENRREEIDEEIKKLEKKKKDAEASADSDIKMITKFEHEQSAIESKSQEIRNKLQKKIDSIDRLIQAQATLLSSVSLEAQTATQKICRIGEKIKKKIERIETIKEAVKKSTNTALAEELKKLNEEKGVVEEEINVCMGKIEEHTRKMNRLNKKVRINQIHTNDLQIPDVSLKQKAIELMNTAEQAASVKVNIPDSLPATDNGLKTLFEVMTAYADQIEEVKIGSAVKYEIDSFVDYLKQPDLALKTLDLSHAGLEDKDVIPILNALKDNPANLWNLYLANNRLTENSAVIIGEFIKNSNSIRYVNLGMNKLNNEGLKALAPGLQATTSLKVLHFFNNQIVGGEGLEAWAKAIVANPNRPFLFDSICFFDNNPVKVDGIIALEPLIGLEEVTNFRFHVSDLDDLAVEKLCSILKKRKDLNKIDIELTGNRISKHGLQCIEELIKVKQKQINKLNLWLSLIDDGPEYFPLFFQKVNQHTHIRLGGLGLNAQGLEKILPSLDGEGRWKIELYRNPLGDEGLKVLCNYLEANPFYCKGVELLQLNGIGCQDLDPLIKLLQSGKAEGLRNLALESNGIRDDQLQKLAKAFSFSNLRTIELSGNPISIVGITALLEQMQALKVKIKINVGWCLKSEDADVLYNHPKLSKETIQCLLGGGPAWDRLQFLLKGQQEEIQIDSSGCCQVRSRNFSDAQIKDLVSKLEAHKGGGIKTLDLSGNQVTATGVEALISDYLLKDEGRIEQLKILNLSSNPLTDSVKDSLLKLLKHPKCALEEIHLAWTQMTHVGLNPILANLKSGLKVCHIAGNNLKDVVATATTGPLTRTDETVIELSSKDKK